MSRCSSSWSAARAVSPIIIGARYMASIPAPFITGLGRKNWLFSDTPDGAQANALYLTMVEMAKAYDLNLYEYLEFVLEHRPSKTMTDDELSILAPWSETVQQLCKNKME